MAIRRRIVHEFTNIKMGAALTNNTDLHPVYQGIYNGEFEFVAWFHQRYNRLGTHPRRDVP
jgi:hypothetical protein